MVKKLNSMRWLEQRNIAYEASEFDPNVRSADEAAASIGANVAQVFKTLVVLDDDEKPMLVLVAGNDELDLKALAKATGNKKVQMASQNDAEKMTGLQKGGISALELISKNWPIYIDSSATQFEYIYMSAGRRGINLRVPRQEIIEILEMTVVNCSQSPA